MLSGALALGLFAAACGSDDSEGGAGTTASGGAGTTAAGGADTTGGAALEPVAGGKLIMGIEADTGSPWEPSKALLAIAGHTVIRSVYDSLTIVTVDGQVVPYLAESVTPNDDFTVWTIKVREGVSFHDGTPLNSAAVIDNLNRHAASFLTAKVLTDVAKNPDGTLQVAAVDDLTMTITMSRPWVPFPLYLSGAIGYMASPTWQAAADSDPALEAKPVGTGPFVFKSYLPGESFTATKNPSYWNQPYPYLDEVEFRVIPDALTRSSALEARRHRHDPHHERRDHREVPRGSRELPDDRVDGVRRDRLHAAARDAGRARRCQDVRVRCAMAERD